MHCLSEALEGRVGNHSFWKAVPQTEEKRNKSVRHTDSLEFVILTRKGLLEEHVHPGIGGVGWKAKKNRWSSTGREAIKKKKKTKNLEAN